MKPWMIMVCGLVPLGIVIPYAVDGHPLKGLGVAALQIVVATIACFAALFMTISYMEGHGGQAGNPLPVVTMPLGAMFGAYLVSGYFAWRAANP